MGFCRRCGEIVSGQRSRCRCGGSRRESTTKALLNDGNTDKWSQRYLSKSPIPASSPTTGGDDQHPTSPKSGRTETEKELETKMMMTSPTPPRRPPLRAITNQGQSTSRNGEHWREMTLSQGDHDQGEVGEERDGELSSVFGSVLSPKDNWQCVACVRKFKQNEMIYPHPEAKLNSSLRETFFCRVCFADRFSKGVCKKYKCAVLADAPFVKHELHLWHDVCYTCSYCDNPSTESVIDFSGNPSCEDCFDSEAYKTRGIPPSPHLAQSSFFDSSANSTKVGGRSVLVRPAPSKWGVTRANMSLPFGSGCSTNSNTLGSNSNLRTSNTKEASTSDRSPGPNSISSDRSQASSRRTWRNQRDDSPLLASYNELKDQLRKIGLGDKKEISGTLSITRLNPNPSFKRTFNGETPTTSAPLGTPLVPVAGPLPYAPLQSVTKRTNDSAGNTPSAVLTQKRSSNADTCSGCRQVLGYGQFLQIPSTNEVFHRDCFLCGGCRAPLEAGSYVQDEGAMFHSECAPMPPIEERLVTTGVGTAVPPVKDSRSSSVRQNREQICAECGKVLEEGLTITSSSNQRSFHPECLKCSACRSHFCNSSDDRALVEQHGSIYHSMCVPRIPAQKDPLEGRNQIDKQSWSVPSSRNSFAAPRMKSPSKIEIPQTSSNPFLSSPGSKGLQEKALKSPSIFATRTRPLTGLGGLLICSGCSVRATERETVQGPLGRRYHSKCLVCSSCSRGLDSESRLTEDGQLRCEGCRKIPMRLGTPSRALGIEIANRRY